ncbi:Belongs to the TRAFAC class myosin-kinesin ATPase super [Homalodisca vitripennis]|nr:Belongs to the TRAFAC class myosin-kinesin ATPase super [Homalodisca vitripennis]
MDFSLRMSHFWAPSSAPPPLEKPRLFKLRRRWSELELLSNRGHYQVAHADDSPPARRSGALASLCVGRRRSKTESAADLRSRAKFRPRSSPETPVPPIYRVTATLVTDRLQSETVFRVSHRRGSEDLQLSLKPDRTIVRVNGLCFFSDTKSKFPCTDSHHLSLGQDRASLLSWPALESVAGELIWFDPGVGHALPGEVLEYHKPAQVLTVQAVIAGKNLEITRTMGVFGFVGSVLYKIT